MVAALKPSTHEKGTAPLPNALASIQVVPALTKFFVGQPSAVERAWVFKVDAVPVVADGGDPVPVVP